MIRQAGFYISPAIPDEEPRCVTLKDVQVEVEIKDVAAHTTLIQQYKNMEQNAVEVVYCFPLEESAAVCGFEIETDGRTIKGVAEEREKAFKIYDKAIQDGDAAYLLDQEAQDILIISVGNIKHGQEVTVRIFYVSELPVVDGVIRLQIPTTVSPRYVPATEDPVKADRITPPYTTGVPYKFGINVRILSKQVIEITSPSHAINVSHKGSYTIVTLAEGHTNLDRDFIAEIATAQSEEPVCIIAAHENGQKAALVRFYPSFDNFAEKFDIKSEVIFVLDCSGSMEGSSIRKATEARKRMRIFTFGIGYGASHHLTKGVARATGGVCEMIQPGEKIQPKVLRQFARLNQPFISNIKLEFTGADVELPAEYPPLFEGDSYTVMVKVNDAKLIK